MFQSTIFPFSVFPKPNTISQNYKQNIRFNLMTTISRSEWRVLRPGIENPWTRLTLRSSFFLSWTFKLWISARLRPNGVMSVPFKQTPFLFSESNTSCGISSWPDFELPERFPNLRVLSKSTERTESYVSHLIGAPRAVITSQVALVTSGPIPSPGIKVTVFSEESPGSGTYVINDRVAVYSHTALFRYSYTTSTVLGVVHVEKLARL